MPSRRRFIGGCTGAGILALAGCTGVLDDGNGNENENGGTNGWHYDAGARFGAATVGTASVDFGAVREAQLPEQLRSQLQSADENFESVGLDDIDSIEATGFLDGDAEYSGGSIVVLGEFDTDAVGEELRSEGLEPVDGAEGWDRYQLEYGEGGLALSEEAIVYGTVNARDETEIDPVAAAIAAGAGEAAPFTDRENGETLHGVLSGDVSVAVDLGADWRQELGSGFGSGADSLGSIVESTQAFGLDVTFQGETTELSYVVVADPEELDVETVREFLQQVRETEGTGFEDVSVSRDGRAIVASTTIETAQLLATHEDVLFGRSSEPERTTPAVSFDAERTDDGRVQLTHVSGDSVERLEVVYDGVDGRREETWNGDPIAAGNRYVTDAEVADGGTVTVVWRSEDGDQASTLFQATF